MTNCTCIDCMYGGNVGSEHGGIAPPSNGKGDGEMRTEGEANPQNFCAPRGMRTMDDMLRDPENGNGRVVGSGGAINDVSVVMPKWAQFVGAPTHCTAYVVKSGSKARYAKTKEKALQIAAEMLDCDGKVEIKRIELS